MDIGSFWPNFQTHPSVSIMRMSTSTNSIPMHGLYWDEEGQRWHPHSFGGADCGWMFRLFFDCGTFISNGPELVSFIIPPWSPPFLWGKLASNSCIWMATLNATISSDLLMKSIQSMLCFRFWELLVPHLNRRNGTPTFFVKLYVVIYLPYIHIMYIYCICIYIYVYTHYMCVYMSTHACTYGFYPKKNNSVRLRRVWESSDIVLKLNHLRERLVA